MATSLALIIFLGLFSDYLLGKIKLPGLVGMLFVGIALGPHVLNLLYPALLEVSHELRMIALIVILLRAGLKIRRDTINRVGKTALLLSVIPSTIEGISIAAIAPLLFGFEMMEALMLGFIVAAVSPAVVVPSMISAMDKGLGTKKGIPTLILASSSLDNAYVIVVFSTLIGMFAGASNNFLLSLLDVPVSILTGGVLGALLGFGFQKLFSLAAPRATKKTLLVLGAGVLLIWLQDMLKDTVPMSGLIGVMVMGLVILEKSEVAAHAISNKLAKIWVAAEIVLFVLVGAQVDISVAWDAGASGLLLITIGLIARSAGTWVSIYGAGFNTSEKLFCLVAYTPKATVQAAIGAIPLAAGVPGGEVILAVAVLSIIVTAPLGAIGIELTGKRCLEKQ